VQFDPVLVLHYPPDDGGVLASGGSLAGAQDSGNEFARQALKEEQG
jgi:hypothetical protein